MQNVNIITQNFLQITGNYFLHPVNASTFFLLPMHFSTMNHMMFFVVVFSFSWQRTHFCNSFSNKIKHILQNRYICRKSCPNLGHSRLWCKRCLKLLSHETARFKEIHIPDENTVPGIDHASYRQSLWTNIQTDRQAETPKTIWPWPCAPWRIQITSKICVRICII